MNKMETAHRIIGFGKKENRKTHDFYPTPYTTIRSLLDRETFEGSIWEPACGDGAISKVLIEKGYNVYSSDLIDHGYGDDHFDFLTSDRKDDNIITNPPFNISTKFVSHALSRTTRKVAILERLAFLEGKARGKELFSLNKLETVYVFSSRQPFNTKANVIAFAWYVFNHEHNDAPTIQWIA